MDRKLSGLLLLALIVLLHASAACASSESEESEESDSSEEPTGQGLARRCARLESVYVNLFKCLEEEPPRPTKCQRLDMVLQRLGCTQACASTESEERECAESGQSCDEKEGLCPSGQKCCLVPPATPCDVTQSGVTCEDPSTCPTAEGQTPDSSLTCPTASDVCCVRSCPLSPSSTDFQCSPSTTGCPVGLLPKPGFACPSDSDICCERIGPGK